MYLLNLAWFWALAFCLEVCQHLTGELEMFLCVSEPYKEYLVHGALIEAMILTSLLPHIFAQLGLDFGWQCSAHGCINTSQLV